MSLAGIWALLMHRLQNYTSSVILVIQSYVCYNTFSREVFTSLFSLQALKISEETHRILYAKTKEREVSSEKFMFCSCFFLTTWPWAGPGS